MSKRDRQGARQGVARALANLQGSGRWCTIVEGAHKAKQARTPRELEELANMFLESGRDDEEAWLAQQELIPKDRCRVMALISEKREPADEEVRMLKQADRLLRGV